MRFTEFIKSIVSSHSGISSKRICGVLGWLTCIGVLIYCTINVVQAPLMIDTFFPSDNTLFAILRPLFHQA